MDNVPLSRTNKNNKFKNKTKFSRQALKKANREKKTQE
jgi:hypothetical protein